jgi:hypothetical protein
MRDGRATALYADLSASSPASATAAAPIKVRSDEYIAQGDKEIGLSGTVLIPNIDTGATSTGPFTARRVLHRA